jgi:hypothetical protein
VPSGVGLALIGTGTILWAGLLGAALALLMNPPAIPVTPQRGAGAA